MLRWQSYTFNMLHLKVTRTHIKFQDRTKFYIKLHKVTKSYTKLHE